MGIDMRDIPCRGADKKRQISAKLAITMVESGKHMERMARYNGGGREAEKLPGAGKMQGSQSGECAGK